MPDIREYLDLTVKIRGKRPPGEQYGEVIAVDTNPEERPLIVRFDNGGIGYYHPKNVTIVKGYR